MDILTNIAFKSYIKNIFLICCLLLLTIQCFAQIPTITDVSAITGSSGSTITISGTNFSNTTKVYLGTIEIPTIYKGTLTATIPMGVSYNRISVVDPATGLSDYSDYFFTLKTPLICGLNQFSFDTAKVLSTGIVARNIALADLNKDGLEDLLILSPGKLVTYKNTSSTAGVSFASSSTTYNLISKSIPTNIVVCDLNNDGYMDAVIGYSTGNQVTILKGTSKGGFSTDLTNIAVGTSPELVAVGDLIKDGILEIITGNITDKTISIVKYNTIRGVGSYSVEATINSISANSIAIGDINTDGNKDIIIADGKSGYYLKNNGEGVFTNAQNTITTIETSLVNVGDYNTHKVADALFSVKTGVYTSYNNIIADDSKLTSAPIAMSGLDINFDGMPDLATLYIDKITNTNHIAFYIYDVKNGLTSPNNGLVIETGIMGKVNLLSGDLDGDGQADLITYKVNGDIYIYHKSNALYLYNISGAAVCEGQDATVSAKTNTGTITWYSDDKKSKIIGTGNSISVNSVKSQITVYVQSTNGGCSSALNPVTITVKPLPKVTLTATGQTNFICPNNSTTLTAGGTATSYIWSPTTDITSTKSIIDVIPKDAKAITGNGVDKTEHYNIYTYTVTGSLNGCTNSTSINLNVYDPIVAVSSPTNQICSGLPTQLSVTINNGTFKSNTFQWSSAPVDKNSKLIDGAIIQTISPVNTTLLPITYTYSISGLTIAGCSISDSKTITVNPVPSITPTSLLNIKVGQTFKQDFNVLNGTNTSYKLSVTAPNVIPPGLSYAGNTLQGTPTIAGTYNFTITATETGKCTAVADYSLVIEDLLDPRLIIFPVFVNVGDAGFLLKPSSTLSKGNIEFTIKPGTTSTCAIVGPNGFINKIVCADSIPVIVTQLAKDNYRQSQVETYIKISPNSNTKLILSTTGILLNAGETQLKYITNSDATQSTIKVVQLNNADIAKINTDGSITPYKEGTVKIEIRVPATSTYEAITRTYTVTIYTGTQKPVALNDTIVITVNQDTIVNILANDHGVTSAIAPAQTDIDLENIGVQNKFYSLTIGNFLIDLNGNLEIKPFAGFIGEGKINYTVTDSVGVKSDIGFIYVKVIPLTITPALKANEVMTPNNDGLNDGLVIAYAYLDKNNSLTILDVVGNVVYETTNYQNDWRGINKKGDSIEPGVYFYVYEEKESGRSLKQYIQIIK